MKKKAKSTRENLADLTRAYGSFAELGRRFAGSLGVKESTAAKYVAQMIRGERDIPQNIKKGISRRVYYEQVTKPRRQIARASDIADKLELAANSKRRVIDLKELLPEGFSFFGFDFQALVESDPRLKYVKEAINMGLNIRVSAVAESESGSGRSTGIIGGTEEVRDPRSKKRKMTKKYISEMYHILRRAYDKTGAVSWIVSGFSELGDLSIEDG